MVKKVLIFSVAYYPNLVGGAEVAVKEITDRLPPLEYEFHLLALRFDKNLPKEEKIGNVHVYRLGFRSKYAYSFLAAIKGWGLSRKHNFSLSWSIMANYSGFAALFFKILKPEIPFLLTLQEGDPIDYIKKRVSVFYPIFKKIFEKADALQAISNYLVKWGKDMGFKGEPRLVPNGVDIKRFDIEISEEQRLAIRKDLGLVEGDTALVTTSRLVVKNGVGDVIKALPLLSKNIKFVILGEGYLEESLKSEAKTLGVEDRTIFKGFVSHDLMPKYLKACDIFVRPSLSEGFGNSFIEAMAARLPVIATRVGGIADFLEDPAELKRSGVEDSDSSRAQTGYACLPGNPQSVTEAVNRVVNDVGENKVVETAYRMAVEKYDWNLIVKQMGEVFEALK